MIIAHAALLLQSRSSYFLEYTTNNTVNLLCIVYDFIVKLKFFKCLKSVNAKWKTKSELWSYRYFAGNEKWEWKTGEGDILSKQKTQVSCSLEQDYHSRKSLKTTLGWSVCSQCGSGNSLNTSGCRVSVLDEI